MDRRTFALRPEAPLSASTLVRLSPSHHEILDPDRKPSQANAGCVPDGIGDRAGRAGDAEVRLANPIFLAILLDIIWSSDG
jgi:hypothetical protein